MLLSAKVHSHAVKFASLCLENSVIVYTIGSVIEKSKNLGKGWFGPNHLGGGYG